MIYAILVFTAAVVLVALWAFTHSSVPEMIECKRCPELENHNKELTQLLLEYKVRLEAKELGLPFPSVQKEEETIQRVLNQIKQEEKKEQHGT